MTTIEKQELVNRHVSFDQDVWLVQSYKSGWYALVGCGEIEGQTAKVRFADIDHVKDVDYVHDAEAEDEESGPTRMASQLKKYRETYTLGVAPSGRKSLNNGDALALALEQVDLPTLYGVVNELLDIDLRAKYEHLNIGSQRMNLGNRLRSAVKNEEHPKHAVVMAWIGEQGE